MFEQVLLSNKVLPEVLSVEVVAKTQIFEVQSVDLRFSNGEERTYERLTPQRRATVMVVPIMGDKLVFVREYAVGPERYELTFPKGIVDSNESLLEAANRELQEEIGFAARKLRPLRSLYSGPSHGYGLMHVFVAEELYPSALKGDEPEALEIVYYPIAEIDALLANPDFAESRNLSALFLLREQLHG